MLGCGNSAISEDMYDAGYKRIVNVDFCENVIEFMKERNKARTGMECKMQSEMMIDSKSFLLVVSSSPSFFST